MDSDRCTCDKSESPQDTGSDTSTSSSSSSTSLSPTTREKKHKIRLTSFALNLRRGLMLQFKASSKRSQKKSQPASVASPSSSSSSACCEVAAPDKCIKKSPKWPLKFHCTKKESKNVAHAEAPNMCCMCCTCICYRRTEEHHLGPGVVFETANEAASSNNISMASAAAVEQQPVEEVPSVIRQEPVVVAEAAKNDVDNGIYGSNNVQSIVVNPPSIDWVCSVHEDCDEAARRQRAREIEQGVDPPANFRTMRLLYTDMESDGGTTRYQLMCPSNVSVDSLRALFQNTVTLQSCPLDIIASCHTQVDFIHCLVPDLLNITNCSFYWGKMDRYEAERLLDGKPEGTFLLRDSAQEEFLFSVSFRKYGRSLHARIEQWDHKFSFDSHDPGVYMSDTICGLIEHYKDPSSCMFFEPILTSPLHRNFTFSLQHLSRATITTKLTYDDINYLQLPKTLKSYLKEYHYRQKVRVRVEDDMQWFDLKNIPPTPPNSSSSSA